MQSSLCERVNGADIVFEGKVVKVLENKGEGVGAEFEVTRYFKGLGPKKLTIYGFGYGVDCNVAVAQGDVRIVFAKGDPKKDAALMANRIKGLDQAQVVTKETADEIQRITKLPIFAPQP